MTLLEARAEAQATAADDEEFRRVYLRDGAWLAVYALLVPGYERVGQYLIEDPKTGSKLVAGVVIEHADDDEDVSLYTETLRMRRVCRTRSVGRP